MKRTIVVLRNICSICEHVQHPSVSQASMQVSR
jgi:hypothetical protein